MRERFIPYHLRQNKAIDRNLFVETLSMINRYFLINKYEYVGMGGPFLEDFKVIHAASGVSKMISLETDGNTVRRQRFNRPLSCIQILNESSTAFIRRYDFVKPSVIWLDFTTPSKLASNLIDVFELIKKLKCGDVFRITLNASASSIPASDPDSKDLTLQSRRLEYLRENIDDYLPSDTDESMLTNEEYPRLLFRTVRKVVDMAVGNIGDTYFQPLTSYVYADGAQMLTYCGIILNRSQTKDFMKATRLQSWNLAIIKKAEPIHISVPELSIRERMFLDSLLPKFSSNTLQKRLKHLVAAEGQDSLKGLENYVRYYKQFPYYSKIVP